MTTRSIPAGRYIVSADAQDFAEAKGARLLFVSNLPGPAIAVDLVALLDDLVRRSNRHRHAEDIIAAHLVEVPMSDPALDLLESHYVSAHGSPDARRAALALLADR